MLARISSTKLDEWEEFFMMEPWGYHVDALQTATICATLANYAGKRLADGVALSPADFMPGAQPRQKSADELSGDLHATFSALIG